MAVRRGNTSVYPCMGTIQNYIYRSEIPYYHSANPINLPFQLHQIGSSSSSLTSDRSGSALFRLSSGPDWQVTRTPSVLTPVDAPRRRGLPFPTVDASLPPQRPESMTKSRSILSSDALALCRGSHAGCEKRRGARSRTCVCVGAANNLVIRHGFASQGGSAAPNSTAIPPPLSAFAFTNVRASRRSAARRVRCSSACVRTGFGAR